MSLFIDYSLVDIGIPEDFLESESELTDQITSPALYPLFAIYEYFDENQGFWVRKAISLADLTSEQFLLSVTPGARVSAFSRNFIDELSSAQAQAQAQTPMLPAVAWTASKWVRDVRKTKNKCQSKMHCLLS